MVSSNTRPERHEGRKHKDAGREKMIDQKDVSRLRDKLLERREEIFRFRKGLNESWAELQEPEIEYEETSAKEKISQGIDRLDEQDRQEIESVDSALRKIEEGEYGVCESCGRDISLKRLDAVPWARLCIQCAREREGKAMIPPAEPEGPASDAPPSDYRGMSDAEIREAIYDELRNDGRVELEELDIYRKKGVLYLQGALPSETKHQILLEVLEDILDFHDVVDDVRIDELLWEREDRMPVERDAKKTDFEELLQGEDSDDEDGTSVQPPDALVPEKGER